MRRPRTPLRLLALLALALFGGACKQHDSILLVEVYGPRDLMALQLSVTVIAGEARNIIVQPDPPGEAINLPASFTIALDPSHMGPVTISIDALDDQRSIVAFGTTTMQHIQLGGQTDIAVTLTPGPPPDMPDAGEPADSGQAGADGGPADGGAGGGGNDGGGGTGGASGQGGASGRDGSADRSDAMGLDGATD